MKKIDPSSGVPLYLQLADLIEKEIKSGMLAPGSQVPSENTLVKQHRISRATVRQAYHKLVDRGFLLKIRGRGTFVSHNWGSHEELRVPENKLLAFLMRDAGGGVQPALIRSISSSAFQFGYSVTVNNTGNSLELALEYVNRIAEQGVRGIVFRPLAMSPFDEVNFRICEEIQIRRIPFVFVDIPVNDVTASCIRSDNVAGGKRVGTYLRNLGHHHVTILRDCVNPTTEDRIEGFAMGLKQQAPIVQYFPEIDGDFERKMEKILNASKPPSALFCLHDLIAHHVIEYLKQRNVRVPEEIGVVGFDNLDFSPLLDPSLTTVNQHLDRMGDEAVRELLRIVEHPKTRIRDVRLPVELIERGSVKKIDGR